MFGYTEGLYEVLENKVRAIVPLESKEHALFELRQGGRHETPYIAFMRFNHENQCVADTLLIYDDEETVQADWKRILNDAEVKIADLDHFERIEGHITGFRKDGSVAMY